MRKRDEYKRFWYWIEIIYRAMYVLVIPGGFKLIIGTGGVARSSVRPSDPSSNSLVVCQQSHDSMFISLSLYSLDSSCDFSLISCVCTQTQ